MPSNSEKQRKFFQLVYAYKKGEVKDVSQKVKDAAKSMTFKQLKDMMTVDEMTSSGSAGGSYEVPMTTMVKRTMKSETTNTYKKQLDKFMADSKAGSKYAKLSDFNFSDNIKDKKRTPFIPNNDDYKESVYGNGLESVEYDHKLSDEQIETNKELYTKKKYRKTAGNLATSGKATEDMLKMVQDKQSKKEDGDFAYAYWNGIFVTDPDKTSSKSTPYAYYKGKKQDESVAYIKSKNLLETAAKARKLLSEIKENIVENVIFVEDGNVLYEFKQSLSGILTLESISPTEQPKKISEGLKRLVNKEMDEPTRPPQTDFASIFQKLKKMT